MHPDLLDGVRSRNRGLNPEVIPELFKYAAQEVASQNPRLIGARNAKDSMKEESRRRSTERVTEMSRTRTSNKKDTLPEITDRDVVRGSRMGLNMDDPKVRKSIQLRRRYYEGRRR